MARPDRGLCLANGLVRTAIGSKPVAAAMEVFLPARLQHLCNRLLDKPIQHRRYSQLAAAAIWLGISTRRTGLGRYVPSCSCCQITGQYYLRCSTDATRCLFVHDYRPYCGSITEGQLTPLASAALFAVALAKLVSTEYRAVLASLKREIAVIFFFAWFNFFCFDEFVHSILV